MPQKNDWLPVDRRLIPDIFSFRYPKSPWVRGMLVLEMTCAVLAVIGTFLLTILPPSSTTPRTTTAATDSATRR